MAVTTQKRQMMAMVECIVVVCDNCGVERIVKDERDSSLDQPMLEPQWLIFKRGRWDGDYVFCSWQCVAGYAVKQYQPAAA